MNNTVKGILIGTGFGATAVLIAEGFIVSKIMDSVVGEEIIVPAVQESIARAVGGSIYGERKVHYRPYYNKYGDYRTGVRYENEYYEPKHRV